MDSRAAVRRFGLVKETRDRRETQQVQSKLRCVSSLQVYQRAVRALREYPPFAMSGAPGEGNLTTTEDS
jgi:hypothetical protein